MAGIARALPQGWWTMLADSRHGDCCPACAILRQDFLIQGVRERNLMPKRYTRLTQPLVKSGGELKTASWDAALDTAADGFRTAIERHGPDTFGLFSCSKATNEVNYLAQKFARQVIGCNNVDSCNRT